jgi:hypothetical protein
VSAVPSIRESDFQRQVTDLAEIYHWSYVHFRPARTAQGWRTPVQGPLGKGWPDLILVRGDRLMAVELKAEGKLPTIDQIGVLGVLAGAGAETHVWHPEDFDAIQAALS